MYCVQRKSRGEKKTREIIERPRHTYWNTMSCLCFFYHRTFRKVFGFK